MLVVQSGFLVLVMGLMRTWMFLILQSKGLSPLLSGVPASECLTETVLPNFRRTRTHTRGRRLLTD